MMLNFMDLKRIEFVEEISGYGTNLFDNLLALEVNNFGQPWPAFRPTCRVAKVH